MINRQLAKLIPFSLLLILTITACQNKTNTTPEQNSSNNTNTETTENSNQITSDNGKMTVSVPKSWKPQQNLNAQADLQVADPSKENYLIVLSDSKVDFDNIDLQKHSEITRGLILENITNGKITEGPKNIIIQGKPALQYEIQGSVNGINIVYLHTTVEGNEYFHQVLAWTTPSKIEQNGPILESVINSFQEN